MDAVFPFGFPASTAFYLTLYVLTFVVHQLFMHYVLAGSLYLAWVTAVSTRESVAEVERPLVSTLRDWMPFLLSAAITAGIAPLLFIQIVYQDQFYTANLLLWWRWMIVVPVLIGAFYLLYLLKSSMLWRAPYAVRLAVAISAAVCFVFVGFCWTANHLLSCSGSDWPAVYSTGRLPFSVSLVVTRMLIWLGGSFATMSVIAGWQMLWQVNHHSVGETVTADAPRNIRILASLAYGGIVVSALAGVGYLGFCVPSSRNWLFSVAALPYLLMIVLGTGLLVWGWQSQWRSKRFNARHLGLTTAGTVLNVLGVAVIREGVRIQAVDLKKLAVAHVEAAGMGGFSVFLFCAVLVTALIIWCVRIVQPATKT